MELEELYQDLIVDHYKSPRCKGCVHNADSSCQLHNPLCGDQIEVSLKADGGAISELKFRGHGCALSQASASMMAELCQGKSVSELKILSDQFRSMMRGESEAKDLPELGEALSLEGVRKFAVRVKCVTLAWETLRKCLEQVQDPPAN